MRRLRVGVHVDVRGSLDFLHVDVASASQGGCPRLEFALPLVAVSGMGVVPSSTERHTEALDVQHRDDEGRFLSLPEHGMREYTRGQRKRRL